MADTLDPDISIMRSNFEGYWRMEPEIGFESSSRVCNDEAKPSCGRTPRMEQLCIDTFCTFVQLEIKERLKSRCLFMPIPKYCSSAHWDICGDDEPDSRLEPKNSFSNRVLWLRELGRRPLSVLLSKSKVFKRLEFPKVGTDPDILQLPAHRCSRLVAVLKSGRVPCMARTRLEQKSKVDKV